MSRAPALMWSPSAHIAAVLFAPSDGNSRSSDLSARKSATDALVSWSLIICEKSLLQEERISSLILSEAISEFSARMGKVDTLAISNRPPVARITIDLLLLKPSAIQRIAFRAGLSLVSLCSIQQDGSWIYLFGCFG